MPLSLPSLFPQLSFSASEERFVSQDLAQDWQRYQRASLVVPMQSSTLLECRGDDHLEFIQGKLSNDVKKLAVGQWIPALLLSIKGHALAQLQVLKTANALLLVCEGGSGEFVRAELERHIIFDQVTLTPRDDLYCMSCLGAKAQELSSSLFPNGLKPQSFSDSAFSTDLLTLLCGSSYGDASAFQAWCSLEGVEALLEHLTKQGATLSGENFIDLVRIKHRQAHASSEAGQGVLPQEAGLDGAISYRKGCYLGQEIMARIEARTAVKRGLYQVALSEMPTVSRQEIYAEGKKQGQLGCVQRDPESGKILALAVLKHDAPKSLRLATEEHIELSVS